MTCKCLVSEAASVMQAVCLGDLPATTIRSVITDSRKLQAGDLFVALVGENFDGHNFVEQAIANGAVAVVVSTPPTPSSTPILLVPDTLKAYQALAHWWRNQTNLPVIAVTGSAGKTTTKELISTLLSHYTPLGKEVHKSQANHNNDIGVAQTLLAIAPEQHDFVVTEMGMRGKGEIARLAQVARPNISVITNIGTAHIGRLGSQAAIAAAKCELLQNMSPDGVAILNAEDELLRQTASAVWQGHTLTFGIGMGDIHGELLGSTLLAKSATQSVKLHLPLAGRHNTLNLLAALAVLQALSLDWQVLNSDIGDLSLPAGRAQVHHLAKDVMVLDETYNASPEAVMAALHLLSETPAQRRWAILGTMKELGDRSEQLHAQVGETVRKLGIDCLLVLADGEAEAILVGAGKSLSLAKGCANYDELTQTLLRLVQPGDRILFKASRSVGMERVVQDFKQAWHTKHS